MTDEKQSKVTDAGSFRDSAKMVITVTLVSALAAGILGAVYAGTKDRIKASREAEKATAFGYILPDYDKSNDPAAEANWRCLAWPKKVLEGDQNYGNRDHCAKQLYIAHDKSGGVVGYVEQLTSTEGFGPAINLLVGATPDGVVTGVYILSHQETPGLGAQATLDQTDWPEWRKECPADKDLCDGSLPDNGNQPFLRQFTNRDPGTDDPGEWNCNVTKDGGEVDAITASTITSRAVSHAVDQAAEEIEALGKAAASGAAASGAEGGSK